MFIFFAFIFVLCVYVFCFCFFSQCVSCIYIFIYTFFVFVLPYEFIFIHFHDNQPELERCMLLFCKHYDMQHQHSLCLIFGFFIMFVKKKVHHSKTYTLIRFFNMFKYCFIIFISCYMCHIFCIFTIKSHFCFLILI